jgi:hypothetical protein
MKGTHGHTCKIVRALVTAALCVCECVRVGVWVYVWVCGCI